jgi:hypothetical protein
MLAGESTAARPRVPATRLAYKLAVDVLSTIWSTSDISHPTTCLCKSRRFSVMEIHGKILFALRHLRDCFKNMTGSALCNLHDPLLFQSSVPISFFSPKLNFIFTPFF